jgi:ankyrin repeat protein
MESPFFRAVKEGNEGEVARLLDENPALLEKTGHEGLTPYLLAAMHGQLGVMQLLIQRGADTSATADFSGSTALHMAAWGGQEQAAALLLGQGTQSTHREADGTTPSMLACKQGHLGVMRLLLQHLGIQALQETDRKGFSVLHWAASCGKEEIVSFLLGQGALPGSRDGFNATPLMLACAAGHMGVVKVLLQHIGAQAFQEALQETDEIGGTALHLAAECGHEGIVTLLLGQGAQANSKDEDGRTPLLWACEEGQLNVVQMLVQHIGPEALQMWDRHDMTALHWACEKGRGEVARLLLLSGADFTIRDNQGMTPREIAEEEEDDDEEEEEEKEKGSRAGCVAAFEVWKLHVVADTSLVWSAYCVPLHLDVLIQGAV